MLEQIILIFYVIIIIAVCVKIIIDTTSPPKSMAYLLLILALPIIGVIIYLSIGLNYRKRKLYQKKIEIDEVTFPELHNKILTYTQKFQPELQKRLGYFYSLTQFLKKDYLVSLNNSVQLLSNGEEKFPEVLKALQSAKHHIHIEYYIFENDHIGNQIADILLQKHQEGVKIRFIYDDFGSKNIRNNIVKTLQNAAIECVPFYKIIWITLANRLNYRNHRKIIVVDGKVGFVGGINVCDKYINPSPNGLYWRDTHIKLEGLSVLNLQYTFLTDWNFCAGQNISFDKNLFPVEDLINNNCGSQIVQILPSGPDSDYPNILFSLIQVILHAKKEVCITTPYFIPNKSLLDAIKIAALSGVIIKLLVPKISDSVIVNLTTQSYFEELLEAGVHIYRYKKGFVHAKTMVCDNKLAVVGTANLDHRSFDLNFEINTIVYDENLALNLKNQFDNDIHHSELLGVENWKKRSFFVKFAEKLLNLFSPLM